MAQHVYTPSSQPEHVRDIDFRRPSKFSREQLRQLEHAHGSFCQSVSSRLSAELRTEFEMTMRDQDQLPYSVVMLEEVPRDALVLVLEVEPLGTEVCLVLEMELAMVLVNRFLGGSRQQTRDEVAGLTDLEILVARRAVDSLVDSLSTTWEDLADVTLVMSRVETSSASAQLAPAQEPTLLMTFTLEIDGVQSVATFVIPHRAIGQILPRLEQGKYGPARADEYSRLEMGSVLAHVPVNVRVEVGSREMELGDILSLKVGDVLPLRRPERKGMTVFVEDVPRFTGSLGVYDNVRALELQHRVEEV